MYTDKSSNRSEEDGQEINPVQILAIVIDNWRFITLITGLFGALALAYLLSARPLFEAISMLEVEPKSPGAASFSERHESVALNVPPAIAQTHVMKSAAVLGAAVDALELDISVRPKAIPVIGEFLSRHFIFDASQSELPLIEQLDVPERLRDQPLRLLIGQDGAFQLFDPKGRELLSGIGPHGAKSADDAVQLKISRLDAEPGSEFVLTKEPRLAALLRLQNQLEIDEVEEGSGIFLLSITDTDPERAVNILAEVMKAYVAQNIERAAADASSGLEFLTTELPAMRAKLEQSELALNRFQTQAGSVDISLEIEGYLNQLVALDSKISALRLQQTELASRFTSEHPAYQTLVNQIESLTLEQQSLARKISTLPETQQELVRLSRDVKVNNEIYLLMLNRAQELEVMRNGIAGNVHVLDQPVADTISPAWPNRKLVVLGGLVFGFGLALAIVFIRRKLFPSIESIEEIERLGLPVLAAVPMFSAKQLDGVVDDRATAKQPAVLMRANDPYTEALRSLRTCLRLSLPNRRNNLIMLSGPSPAVGKSFISLNLAVLAARAGQRVLLIDADMRRGHLHEALALSEENGFAEVLQNQSSVTEAIRLTAVENLSFLPRGKPPLWPAELLLQPILENVLQRVGELFDLVVIDTPPLLAVSDALIIGQHTGVNLMVLRFDFTATREVELALRRFEQNNTELHGAIFNSVEERTSTRYGYSKSCYRLDYRTVHS